MNPDLSRVERSRHIFGRAIAALLLAATIEAWASVTVSLTAPANGSTYEPPVNITLSASASAGGGYTVSKVEFFNGTTLIGTDLSSPYSVTWSSAPSGVHSITAKATAIKKNSPDETATSTAATITVNSRPTVSITSPPEIADYNIPPPVITVTAAASDSDGSISRVEFWEDQCTMSSTPGLLATVTSPPYSFDWTIPPPYVEDEKPQSRCFKAIAFDNLGAQETSGLRSVSFWPTIALSSPANGAVFAAPASIPLNVTFTPPDYPIGKMQYYNGETLIGEVLAAPYSFNWENVPIGSYSLTVRMISLVYQFEFASAPIAVVVSTPTSQLHFIHSDHLNTPRHIYDSSAQLRWRWDQMEPFGVNVADENPSSLGTFEFPLRYPGQHYDNESGHFYNIMRDYDSYLGRYIESDLIGLLGGLNTYAYANGSAIGITDPLGLSNGCGPEGGSRLTVVLGKLLPSSPLHYPFRTCCDKHDDCYRDCETKVTKYECDQDMYNCLRDLCSYAPAGQMCMRVANVYAFGVTGYGGGAFNAARSKCDSCSGKQP